MSDLIGSLVGFTIGEEAGVASPGGLPQCAAPFTIGPHGTITVEQGSEENIAGNVYNVAVCPQGFRDDLPEFGVPSLLWQRMPLDLTGLQQALARWEPQADLTLEQHRIAAGEAQVAVIT